MMGTIPNLCVHRYHWDSRHKNYHSPDVRDTLLFDGWGGLTLSCRYIQPAQRV